MKNVLLSGPSGSGKTTLIKKAVRRLGERAGGFYTEEIRAGNRIEGFRIASLGGREARLATRGGEGEPRLGEFSVHLDALEAVAVPAVRDALRRGRIVVVDEIGPMGLLSDGFVQAIDEALSSAPSLLGTITRDAHPKLDEIRNRADTLVLELSRANRDLLLDRIWAGLRLPTESFAETERNIAKKRAKAARYAREDRLSLSGLTARFRSDHHEYDVSFEGGQWHCGCSFFLKYGTCSHTMASAEMLRRYMRTGPAEGDPFPGQGG